MSDSVVFSDEKRGYNKEQVNRYIEELNIRYNTELKEKNNEIAQLKNVLEDCRKISDEIGSDYQNMKEDKERIASVLVDAKIQADKMIAAAKKEAEEEKNKLLDEIDEKRNNIVEKNKMLRDMRIDICKLFDDMKKNMNVSYEGIIKTVENDLEKFTEDSQKISDKYPKEIDAEV